MSDLERRESDDLLTRVAQGDEAAVGQCVERFGGLVWSLALKFSSDRAEAEDAVQEVFVDVWRSAARYDAAKASPQGFIAMIARRRLIDRRRKQDRRPVLVALPDHVDAPDDAHERLHRSIDAGDAARALEVLKPEQRRLLELSLVEGLSHAEIAERTGTPLGTVKSTIRRGLAAARAALRGPQEVR